MTEMLRVNCFLSKKIMFVLCITTTISPVHKLGRRTVIKCLCIEGKVMDAVAEGLLY